MQRLQKKDKILFKWSHLPPDLMRLVTSKLNYQEQVNLCATC